MLKSKFFSEYPSYQIIPSTRGNGMLLMINGYTYWQMFKTANYYCSKKQSAIKCNARVKLDLEGNIIFLDECHEHPPPKYMVHSGKYIKIG